MEGFVLRFLLFTVAALFVFQLINAEESEDTPRLRRQADGEDDDGASSSDGDDGEQDDSQRPPPHHHNSAGVAPGGKKGCNNNRGGANSTNRDVETLRLRRANSTGRANRRG